MNATPEDMLNAVLSENTAQSVHKALQEQEANRAHVLPRWIWELLQNARDASFGAESGITAFIEYIDGVLTFRHTGKKFNEEEIAHLIYSGSTKKEGEESIGQYGSGFITTHLLSKEIKISGQLGNGAKFLFGLERSSSDSTEDLQKKMRQAWDEFHASQGSGACSDRSLTQFVYPEAGGASDAVETGIASLKSCAPYVIAFNREFSSIEIQTDNESIQYVRNGKSRFVKGDAESPWKVTVTEKHNALEKQHVLLMAESEDVSVAAPLESLDEGYRCAPLTSMPKLFLGFPLINTEGFGFPATINSLKLNPTEKRDGVFLWQSDHETNRKNQEIIQVAYRLLIDLLQFAANSGWCNVSSLATVPAMRDYDWLNLPVMKENLRENFIDKVRHTPVVAVSGGTTFSPANATLPFSASSEKAESLWDLLEQCSDKCKIVLPRREEVIGWCSAIKSWRNVTEVAGDDGAFDGNDLARLVQDNTRQDEETHTKEYLQAMLGDAVCAVAWLEQLHAFLIADGFPNVAKECRIVLSQSGHLHTLDKLYRDQGVAEDLKEIADGILGLNVREELRDKRLVSLAGEHGRGEQNSKDTIRKIVDELKDLANQDLCKKFADASVATFAWAASQQDWTLLADGFPVYSAPDKDDKCKIMLLRSTAEKEIPLAPVLSWSEDLREYYDVFPPQHILADAYFRAVHEPGIWASLSSQNLCRENVIFEEEQQFDNFLPDELLRDDAKVHKTTGSVAVTDVAFFTKRDVGVMARVSRNKRRARLLWRFLNEWLIQKDANGLEQIEADCECDGKHRYFPARWLVPIKGNRWVPDGMPPTAESLAGLLNSGEQGQIPQSDSRLLNAIGISPLDLDIALKANNDPDVRKHLEEQTREFVQLCGEDSEILGQLKRLQEERETRRKNQKLGQLVEESVKQVLKKEGFVVERTGTGSDFEVFIENDHTGSDTGKAGLAATREGKGNSWLIEVKATCVRAVHMTPVQAQEAKDNANNFLLCVVPVETSDPDLDSVKRNMRFVKNIGTRVSSLCDDLEEFESRRTEITEGASAGAHLVITSGARIRIAQSVWESEGIPLKDLPDHL